MAKQMQFDENKQSYNISNIGDGQKGGQHHADGDSNSGYSKNFLNNCNVITPDDSDYAGDSSNIWERTSVDVSKADRGKEY
jgi:hypothetical protein